MSYHFKIQYLFDSPSKRRKMSILHLYPTCPPASLSLISPEVDYIISKLLNIYLLFD